MNAETEIAEVLHTLEARLLDPLVRCSPSEVDRLLSDDFVEFGSSGRVYDKAIMIEALRQDPGFDGPRTIINFKALELSSLVVLVTYRIRETGTLRSSIWRSNGEHWEMVFHQGTCSASG
ncbi:DUF4440 domain-containing protein [Pelagibius litoralis]